VNTHNTRSKTRLEALFARVAPRLSARVRRNRPANARGMTLIEVMVVITILGLIASLVGVAVFNQLKKAKVKTACDQIKVFEDAVKLYKLDNGSFPTTDQGLPILITDGQLETKSIPKDPWGKEYVFLSPGQQNPDSYDIYSLGEDQKEGGEDPNNWGEPCAK
jgi:general secretion pathway protein G